MPANGRGRAFKRTATASATENIPLRSVLRAGVRVKRCGKSAPQSEQSDWQGKPHAKQDQIGEEEWPAPFNFRVGRWSLSAMEGLEEWLPPASAGTETGLSIAQVERRVCCFGTIFAPPDW